MKKFMIDMDNCITNAYFIERINEFLGTNYRLEEQDDFYLQKLTGDGISQFWEFMKSRSFYGDCPLIDGCYEALKVLNEKYDLYIVTDYLYLESEPDISGNNLKDKYDYLKKMLPFISPSQYIFMKNKNLIHWDIAIDDRVDNLESADVKYLMHAWHNKNISPEELESKNIVKVYSWKEILDLLEGKN